MKRYGLVGYPLEHSLSPQYFNEKFKRFGISDSRYDLFPLDTIEKFGAFINSYSDLQGFNVTIPYKSAIIPYLDKIDPAAEIIGAVNTVKVEHSDSSIILTGFNTDATAFRNSLKPLLKSCHKRALILGTGGSSKAISFVLNELAIPHIFVSRNEQQTGSIQYQEITSELISENYLIINCTPIGMFPDSNAPPIPYKYLSNKHLLYDLVYNPEKTEFMINAERMGALAKNGMEMLHLQADAAWEIWNHN